MLVIYAAQTIIPLVLIAWLAIGPARSTFGFWAQSMATGVTIIALSLVGIWTFPPWWTPHGFLAIFVAVVGIGLARRPLLTRWPRTVIGWIGLCSSGAVSSYAGYEIRIACAGSIIPAGRTVDLASPLGPGHYLVVNGGTAPIVNAHADWLDQTIPAHRRYRGIALGVDIVALDRLGLRAAGVMPADPSRYVIFGRTVIAPCAGRVVVAVDGLPDMMVPQVDRHQLAGNHIILRCSHADVLLGHFQNGSVRVRAGQLLRIGEAVAKVGNSGNTSEPHLHINAQQPGTVTAPFSGLPVPIRIEGRYLVRNSRFVG